MKPSKLQHRGTRTRVKVSKLLEFGVFYCPLWIRRVLVGLKKAACGSLSVAFGSSPGGATEAPYRISRSRRFPHLQPRWPFQKSIQLEIPCSRGLMNLLGCTGLRILSPVVVIQNLAPVVRPLTGSRVADRPRTPLRLSRHLYMMFII